MVVVGGSIPLAPIQKIGRAAARKLLSESFAAGHWRQDSGQQQA
jgi:hypothetical protein